MAYLILTILGIFIQKITESRQEATSEMASLSNSRRQNCKERPNLSTKNGDMDEIAKRSVSEWRSEEWSKYMTSM